MGFYFVILVVVSFGIWTQWPPFMNTAMIAIPIYRQQADLSACQLTNPVQAIP
jgi:hypothetical protein